jgi:hypothetical protein
MHNMISQFMFDISLTFTLTTFVFCFMRFSEFSSTKQAIFLFLSLFQNLEQKTTIIKL